MTITPVLGRRTGAWPCLAADQIRNRNAIAQINRESIDRETTLAVVIIDDLTDIDDLVELMNYLTRALASGNIEHLIETGTLTLTKGGGPSAAQIADMVRLDEDDECLNSWHREGCTCVADAAATDPRQEVLVDAERHDGPVLYVPCPSRGLHAHLTDCWMCWSDVHRGAINPGIALM